MAKVGVRHLGRDRKNVCFWLFFLAELEPQIVVRRLDAFPLGAPLGKKKKRLGDMCVWGEWACGIWERMGVSERKTIEFWTCGKSGGCDIWEETDKVRFLCV